MLTMPMRQRQSMQPCAPSEQSQVARVGPTVPESMTNIFNLVSLDAVRNKSRRRMTDAERVDFRRRRRIGACRVCATRKARVSEKATSKSSSCSLNRSSVIMDQCKVRALSQQPKSSLLRSALHEQSHPLLERYV